MLIRPLVNIVAGLGLLVTIASCSANNETWIKHTVPEGGFSVTMPSLIKKTEKKEATPFGMQTTHFVTWKPSNFAIDKFQLFQVSYTDFNANPGDSAKFNAMLDSAVEMRKKDFSETEVIESQAIELNTYPGRAFFYDAAKGNTVVTIKMCVANHRLYDLVVISKKNYATNKEINSFFDSFELLK